MIIKGEKKVYVREMTKFIVCDGCGTLLYNKFAEPKYVDHYWETWLSDNRRNVPNGECVFKEQHICTSCYDEAMEYIRGKKEAQRNNQTYPETEAGKGFRPPSGDNTR